MTGRGKMSLLRSGATLFAFTARTFVLVAARGTRALRLNFLVHIRFQSV